MSIPSPSGDRRSPPGFLGAWERLVGPRGVPTLATRRGRKPRVPLSEVLPALTFHVMQDTGTLAEHLFPLFRTQLPDSSWSGRELGGGAARRGKPRVLQRPRVPTLAKGADGVRPEEVGRSSERLARRGIRVRVKR